MRSMNKLEDLISVLDLLEALPLEALTFPELMALLYGYERLRRELATVEYELTSPFVRRVGPDKRGG